MTADESRRSLGRQALRGLVWTLVGCLVVLSWIPRDFEIRTSAPGQFEHVVAYAGVALLAGLGCPKERFRWLGACFVLLAGTLEIGQIWVPGRTSQFIDFASSSAGSVIGLAAAQVLARFQRSV